MTPPVADLATAPIPIDLSWHEILRTPDRQLRRLLAQKHRDAIAAHRLIQTAIDSATKLPPGTGFTMAGAKRQQVIAMLDAECERIEARSALYYHRMLYDYQERINEMSTPGSAAA